MRPYPPTGSEGLDKLFFYPGKALRCFGFDIQARLMGATFRNVYHVLKAENPEIPE